MKDWTENNIDKLCIKVTDGSHYSPKELTEGYPMFSVKDMTENGFDYSAVKRISKDDYLRLVKGDCKPRKDDVLIAKDGSYLKHVFVYKEEKEEVILSSIAILRPDTEKIIPDFFKHILRAPSVKGMMESFVSGSALPRIVLKDFKKMKLSLPPLPTQHRIASILSAYDDLIEVNNQRIKLLEQTARELYKEWFVRMRFPGYKQAKFKKGMPEGWSLNNCYSFAEVKGGGTPSTTNPQYWEGKINFFTPTDHSNNFFIFDTEKKITQKGLSNSSTKLFQKYTTFITARGTVGNICLAGHEMAMNQSCFGIIAHTAIDNFFTFLFTDDMVRYLKQVANGATFDAVTLNTFENYKAIIPPIDFRIKFTKVVEPMFLQIETLQQQNTQLRQIRDRLLPRLVSEKLSLNRDSSDVKDDHDSEQSQQSKKS